MNLTNIKAALFRYCELSWPALTQLKGWMRLSKSFDGFDVESFASPSLRVAVATDEAGEPLVFCPVETVMFARAFAINPSASPSEAQQAGNAIDAEIAWQANRPGLASCLLLFRKANPYQRASGRNSEY